MSTSVQMIAWHLDRIASSTILEEDVKRAARQAAYLIRELDLRPEDAAAALATITSKEFR